jgi:hypothetical protein
MTLVGRAVTVVQNAKPVSIIRKFPTLPGSAPDSDEELPGRSTSKAAKMGDVAFRNIIVTPDKD